jgi:hypothetical protein
MVNSVTKEKVFSYIDYKMRRLGCGLIALLIIIILLFLLFSIIGMVIWKFNLATLIIIGVCAVIIILIFSVLFAVVLYAFPIIIFICIVYFVFTAFK